MTRISPTSPNPIAAAEPRMTRARTNERTVFVELNNWESNLKNLNNGPLTQLFDADKPKQESRSSSSREWSDLSQSRESSDREVSESESGSRSEETTNATTADELSEGELSESESRAVADPNPPVDTTFYPLDISETRVDTRPTVKIFTESYKQKVASEQSDEGSLPVPDPQDSTSTDAQKRASASSSEDTHLVPENQNQLRRTDTRTLGRFLNKEKELDVSSSKAPESASPSASSSKSPSIVSTSDLNEDQKLNSHAEKEKRRCCSSLFRSLFSKV